MNFIDSILDRITMYRLALYYLIFLLLGAGVLSYFGKLPFTPQALLYSTVVLLVVSWITNEIFSRVLKIQTNVESVYITALILALIISPPAHGYMAVLPLLFWAGVWSMASKYILNIANKHIFNPAAFAVALTALTIGKSASWWVGTAAMLPFALIGGLLVIRKVRRFDAVLAFTVAALVSILALTFGRGSAISTLDRVILSTPLVFFASIMFTEPLTMPPTKDGRIAYGILVGWLFAPQVHLGSFYFTPELALLAGNVFSYLISPKSRPVFTVVEKREAADGVYDFVLRSDRRFAFKPGQYMEWTLGHRKPDSRGNRRYLTLASSPTEDNVLLGVKFYENPSTFKQNLLLLQPGDKIIGGQLAGDFVLPKDRSEKLAFIAGGIGVTPFRSMLKYMLDKNQRRDVVVLYSNRKYGEIAYPDIFGDAARKLGVRTVFTLTDPSGTPSDWPGARGYLDSEMIKREVPDYIERTFYISGSHTVVTAMRDALRELGLPRSQIVTDFFPGLA